jgi:flavin reductase (DIM6/NTAB) family NADH-FMN oxidoreductase RutF
MYTDVCQYADSMTKDQPMQHVISESSEPVEWGLSSFEAKTLRSILGQYPTGVAIVTTRIPGGQPVGLTINSFASLSLSPPLVLWSLVDTSPSLKVFNECDHFAISILAREHQDLALRFSRPALDKFAGAPIIDTPEGIPVIEGALAV